MRFIREKKLIPLPKRIPTILRNRILQDQDPVMTDNNNYRLDLLSSTTTLWSHLVFVSLGKQYGRPTRQPVIVNGLFNQLFALFAVVDLTRLLQRTKLYIGHFYVNFKNVHASVPLSKIIQFHSLLIPTFDWDPQQEKSLVSFPTTSIDVLEKNKHIQHMEVGCCFMMRLPQHKQDEHIQRLRFHPLFYEFISSFLERYPTYQVVHYRMENDFTEYFFKRWKFSTLKECRNNLFQKYQEKLHSQFDPTIPTLVVSHYYKNPQQPKDHDLVWDNLIHFQLTLAQKKKLYEHLQLPPSTPIREVDAILDFILCTTPNVCSFIGCGASTFSVSVCRFHNDIHCSLINPRTLHEVQHRPTDGLVKKRTIL